MLIQKNNTLLNKNIGPIGFGTAGLSGKYGGYGFGQISEKETEALLNFALEKGINLFDTAPIYGFGEVEKKLQKILHKKREKITIINKGGIGWHENKRVNLSNHPKNIKKMLDQSLKNLNSYIDIYMIHWPDPMVDIREPLEVLLDYQENGKIKHIGLSNPTKNDLDKAFSLTPIHFLQFENNIFNNNSFKYDYNLLYQEKDLFITTWGTFDKGILTNSAYDGRVYEKCDARSFAPWWKKSPLKLKFKIQNDLNVLLQKNNYSLKEVSFKYALKQISSNRKIINSPLIGFRSKEQIEQALEIYNKPIPIEIIETIENHVKKNYL
jgi:myo-inositol catabolism protein IolS